METVICHMTEWFQIGSDAEEHHSSVLQLPKTWKGEAKMPVSDVKLHAKGICSVRYQSVHFGVELTVKDVPFEELERYQQELEEQCFQRLEQMEPKAQGFLTGLLEEIPV